MADPLSRRPARRTRSDVPSSLLRRVFDDTIATYWSITSLFAHDRENYFYGRFSVVVMSLSQLVVLLAIWGAIFGDLADLIGKVAVKILVIALAITLAIFNSLLMYRVDDRLRRERRRFRFRPLPLIILLAYFTLAICTTAFLLS